MQELRLDYKDVIIFTLFATLFLFLVVYTALSQNFDKLTDLYVQNCFINYTYTDLYNLSGGFY
jgi:hypothetical protein